MTTGNDRSDSALAAVGDRTAVIALGSNLDPEANLAAGVRLLAERARIVAASRVYRTPPWGVHAQPHFLNAVVMAESDAEPLEFLDGLLEIEHRLGRVRAIPNGPRTLDLDLLFHGERLSDSERLILPHPRLHERGFVLVPLCDVLPDFSHPRLGKTPRELLAVVETRDIEAVSFTLPV